MLVIRDRLRVVPLRVVPLLLLVSPAIFAGPRWLAAQSPVLPLPLPDLIERVEAAVVRIDVKSAAGDSVGSGFVVGQKGIVVTNHHVIAGAKEATVTFRDGKKSIVHGTKAMDARRDIAVLMIDEGPPGGHPIIPITLVLPRKGEAVVAFGAPRGLSFSASEGIVSAVRQGDELQEYGGKRPGTWIQTTAPVSPGNSGGPLVNRQGQLVAINTMTLAAAQNVNFAISAVDVRSLVDSSTHNEVVPLPEGAALELVPSAGSVPEIAGGSSELEPEKVPDEAVAAFARRGEAVRAEVTKRMAADLETLRDQLKTFKTGTVNRRLTAAQLGGKRFAVNRVKNRTLVIYPDEETKREQVAKFEEAVDKLEAIFKQVRDPKEGLATFLVLAGPGLVPNKVGDIGYLRELEVEQIAGADEFHAYVGDLRVAVRGTSTKGIAKGSKVPGGVMYVCAVEHYRTVLGGSNSVLVIRHFPAEVLKARLAAEAAPEVAATSASAPRVSVRTWRDASGKFSVEAKLVGRSADGSKVELEKVDGTAIEIPIAVLSESDQVFLRTAQATLP
jgi:S1-C subfamily serine protease